MSVQSPRTSVAVALAIAAAAANVASAEPRRTVDLLTQANVRIDGAAQVDSFGRSVAAAGDVNGDGLDDIVVGASQARNNGRASSGSTYVIFGSKTMTTIDVGALGTAGFRIDGAAQTDQSGSSVAGVGDVNGDGRADLAIGAPSADSNGRMASGSTYVVFGGPATTDIDLAALGTRGIRIDGAASGNRSGTSVAGVGDVNGDGRTDLVIGAPGTRTGGTSVGAAVVVYGAPTLTNIDLAAAPGTGFLRVDGPTIAAGALNDQIGTAVAGVGDVNADGRPDFAVGAPFAENNVRLQSGSTYVIYGGAGTPTVNLDTLGAGGFRIDGAQFDRSGSPVAGAGDVNADGRADILVGAFIANSPGRPNGGTTYVVFGAGNSANVDVTALGTRGFRIDGVARTNSSVAIGNIGDINNDGREDLAVASPFTANYGRVSAGSVDVIYGGNPLADIRLGETAHLSFRADGAAAGDQAGRSFAGVGDVNGDGRSDLAIGVPGADANNRADSGSVALLFGFGAPVITYPTTTLTVGQPIAAISPTLSQRAAPVFSATNLPAGLTIDPATGSITGTAPVSGRRSVTVSLADLGGTTQATLALRIRRCTVTRRGSNVRNTIVGDGRSEDIRGRGGNDILVGVANEDCIDGGPGNDVIIGGPANDTLRGGSGRDSITGGRGDDTIYGGPGRDTVNAGRGTDTVFARDGIRDTINCGPGADRARVDRIDITRGCESVERR